MFGAINALSPNDAHIRQQKKPLSVHIIACRLFGAKPLSEPMLGYFPLDPKGHISTKFYSILKKVNSQNEFDNAACKMATI